LYNKVAKFILAGFGWQVARVLRGGSYNNEDRNVRCARRNRNNPNNENNNIGFRVVCVPSHASRYESNQAFCLCAQVRNAFHLRMNAATANGEIVQSCPVLIQ
jgi:hypothetical protein